MADILGIGVSALNAAQVGLMTTEHNIANVNTPGYSRQTIVQSAATPQDTGVGFLGSGVQVDTVQRQYSQFLTDQVNQAQTQASFYSTYSTQVGQINSMLGSSSTGLSPALQNFFSAVQAVANNPADIPSRQGMIDSAQTLVDNFQTMGNQLSQLQQGVNSQLSGSVAQINSDASQIAALNKQIVSAQGGTQAAQPANDLLDQRDALIADLNQQVKTTEVQQADGSVSIFIGNGQPMVLGNSAYTLAAGPASADPSQYAISYVSASGQSAPISSADLTGGNLGGLLAFQSQSLVPAENALGQMAIGVGQAFNAQNKMGVDLNGNQGSNVFDFSSPSGGVAGTASATVVANSNNTGTAQVTGAITDPSQLTTSDYRLSYDGTNYTVTRLTDNAVMYQGTSFPSAPIDGVQLSLSGTMKAGDSYLVEPTRNAALELGVAITNPSAVAAGAAVVMAPGTSNTGTATIAATPSTGALTSPSTLPTGTLTLTYSTTTSPPSFSVTETPPEAGNPYNTTLPVSSNGNYTLGPISFSINGTPANGDTFTITPNYNGSVPGYTGGADDNRNALLLGNLQTANTLAATPGNAPTESFQGAYGALVSNVGNQTNNAQVMQQAQSTLATQATQTQQSLSGVNLDEEASNLVRYEQAYQAAGKMVSVAGTMFQTLLTDL
ncbi:MAG: flagellar hook-associated protein FlgK [Betaproteobacteria bacterium]|nr:flagellar hook-associated protein FlgK [Betaproteobacteria bacterium]